ncbi:hypothetical protein [Brevibacillus reuszeri]|uniref:hypothetical protein n=1 Tax=Brevibacillus reuszeri TaxID=54915 RepID=UPI000CCC0FDA|nr:hypothetical protein [Brevibacillus reuszeri]
MDVLYTETGFDAVSRVFFVLGFILTIVAWFLAMLWSLSADSKGVVTFIVAAVFFGCMTWVAHEAADTYTRHEVTLRPGHVIDATKYEIVEQRGKIYVIEEREAPAE